jgi:hypothetical protein
LGKGKEENISHVEKKKKKKKKNFTYLSQTFAFFADTLLLFKISYFGVSNLCFISNTPLPLNIVVKLNEKIEK